MNKHKHEWIKTGKAYYTCPPSIEYKCNCGKTKWIDGESIKVIKLTPEEFEKKYGHKMPPNPFK